MRGQVFTPPAVADFMVGWVLESGTREVFDPCFGMGAFFEAARRRGCSRFEGMEIDPALLAAWRRGRRGAGSARLVEGNYLRSWERRRGNIVCNPPYLRFQRFPDRQAVRDDFARHLDHRLSGYTNAAAAFLLKSLWELGEGRRLAYLMPLEFLNTGYGVGVKRQLLASGALRAIVSLDCEREVFPGVTTSVGLVLCDADSGPAEVGFHRIRDLAALPQVFRRPAVRRIPAAALDPEAKWLPHFRRTRARVCPERATRLGHYGKFRRGIATGANEFFVLNRSRAAALGLGRGETVPCIARSQQITKPVFDAGDLRALLDRDARALLLRLPEKPSRPATAYLKSGEERGFHRRFLTRHRNPWHRTEARTPSPILFGVFSRGGYKVVRNRSRALNLTCYHGFDPNVFGADLVDRLFLYLASQPGRRILSLSVRRYGDALDKYEPGDLTTAAAPIPEDLARLCPDDADRALRHLARTGETPPWLDAFFEEWRSGNPSRLRIAAPEPATARVSPQRRAVA